MTRNDEVIEPSEILVDQPTYVRQDRVHINPWIRFLARMVDYSLFGILLDLLGYFIFPTFSLGKYEYFIPLEFFAWIPIEALFISRWGYTPGKFLLKTEIKGEYKKLNYKKALRRSFSVWFRGFGMGIPIINIVAMLIAYSKLKMMGITSWDRDEKTKVTHHPIKSIRLGIAIILIFINFGFDFLKEEEPSQEITSQKKSSNQVKV